jgi:TonB family protein
MEDSMKFVFAFIFAFSSIAIATDSMPNEGNLVFAPRINEVLELKIWPKNKANLDGFATVEFTVNKSGKVEGAKIVDAFPKELQQETLKAIQLWLFKPATIDGNNVKVVNSATFYFQRK